MQHHLSISTGLAAAAAIFACAIAPVHAQPYPKPGQWAQLSPFTAVRPAADSAIVRVAGHDYELVSINDQSTSKILEYCHRSYKSWWEKRFTEDLVEVMDHMGYPMAPDQTVKLVLKDSSSGKVTTIARAPMTPENRAAAFQARQESLKDHPEWPR